MRDRTQYRAAHRAQYRAYRVKHNLARKLSAITAYGGKCAVCGEADLDMLELDHIEGGGNAHRREMDGGGGNTYDWLRKHGYPAGFQVLCANHHRKKHAKERKGH